MNKEDINKDLKELMEIGEICLDPATSLPYMNIGGVRTVLFASIKDLIDVKGDLIKRVNKK